MFTAGKGSGPDWLMFQHDVHRQSSIMGDLLTIDKGDLSPGIYFITLTAENRTIATQKMVISF
jgi:hypothetical protein